jgi:hypothetical protein
MPQALTFSIAAACVLTGCGLVRPSSTWQAVRAVRVDTRGEADPSTVYARQLSASLKAAGVPHKIVTYQFRHRTFLREEMLSTRTAVLYRDGSSVRHPWWLMDDTLRKPVWLPGEDENRQVTFYLRHPASVIESTTIEGGSDAKQMLAAPAVAQAPLLLARHEPVGRTERARRFTAPMGARAFAKRERVNPLVRLARVFAPKANETFLPVPGSGVPEPPPTARYAALFQARHGTSFDPASVLDQQKMEQLLLARR